MAGEIQLNSTTFATESSGAITVANVNSATNRTNLGLGSMATQAADSVSISGGNISNAVLASTVTFAKRLSNYQWDAWSPSDNSGTFTNASSSGTTDDTDYTSMSNSSGTLTITFDTAGVYLVSISISSSNSQTYTYQNIQMDFGGSATRRPIIMSPWGPSPGLGGVISSGQTFLISATSSQTLTILPKFRVSSASVASSFTAYANCSVLYCGV
jgi:hypothetical protein